MKRRNFAVNLLAQCQKVLYKQKFYVRKYLGRIINEAGYKVSEFSQPYKFMGNVQPVVTTQYKSLGLDFAKRYIKIYSIDYIETISREGNADEIIYNGDVYHPIPNQQWQSVGDWNSVLAVRVGKYVG